MNNKKITLPVQIIIISFCIGLIISGIGLVKQLNAKKVNEERRQAALKKSQDAINSLQFSQEGRLKSIFF